MANLGDVLGAKFLSSCSFRGEILIKLYLGAFPKALALPPGKILAPPLFRLSNLPAIKGALALATP